MKGWMKGLAGVLISLCLVGRLWAGPQLTSVQELKVHVRCLVGNGNEGKIQEIESRLSRHETYLQRMMGVGSVVAAAVTVMNLVVGWMRVHR